MIETSTRRGDGAGDGTSPKEGKWIKRDTSSVVGRHWVLTGKCTTRKEELVDRADVSGAGADRSLREDPSAVNPYDPEWEQYLEARRGWKLPQTGAGRGPIPFLWKEQGRCLVCGQTLRPAEDDWQIHHRIWRSRGGRTRPTTWSCYTPTVIARSMCEND